MTCSLNVHIIQQYGCVTPFPCSFQQNHLYECDYSGACKWQLMGESSTDVWAGANLSCMLVWSSLGSQSRLAHYIALPFPEAMYSIQHINGYFVELFFFLQWMRTVGLSLVQGNSKCLVMEVILPSRHLFPLCLRLLVAFSSHSHLLQQHRQELSKWCIKSSLFHGKRSLFLWCCLLRSPFPHRVSGVAYLPAAGCAEEVGAGSAACLQPAGTAVGPAPLEMAAAPEGSHFRREAWGQGYTRGDWRLAWRRRFLQNRETQGVFSPSPKLGWSKLCF